ncbi:putative iron-regulated membrane protein [Nitrospirillum amazonense]|uniref:Putative iron-regulated membrane protein n=1 Tax=Nitrospirillum amazonense TaxID=28077 RepID=A0A560ELA0_9PROT|nr:PepSY-associated TM helix domain-containing protein [Nitrospirillum amazonense]TWB10117.1 putative iron-regulated membrane protein [Nitrospirillum amazonense]
MITKRALYHLHKYCGLVAAVFILIQAASGVLLLFQDTPGRGLDTKQPLSQTTHGAAADTVRLRRLQAVLAAAHPNATLRRLDFPSQADAPYLAHLTDPDGSTRYVALDPASAEILRDGSIWRFPAIALLRLHDQMLTGRPGTAAIVLVGLTILVLTLAGLAHWWPRPGRWRQSLTIQRGQPARMILRQGHRILGAVAAVVIAISALTGLTLAVPMVLAAPSPSPTAPLATMSDWDGALTLARARFPGHAVRDLRSQGATLLGVYLRAPEYGPLAVHQVTIDLISGHETLSVPADRNTDAWVIALPIHTGGIAGATGLGLALFAGLSLAMLAITGPAMWLHLALVKARNRRRRLAGAPSPVTAIPKVRS